ncbi:MAG: class I tRNA ligase family protein, partial [Thermoplasmata archaeon]|nr:class I tRNA ligase family protein [Thermoplasmata archaeon]
MTYEHSIVEKKWQDRWAEAKLGEAEPDGREKFFLIFAYPGVSGYLHVGHMRGFTYSDIICRYKRMQGYNVLFPVGSHATGN